MSGAYFYSNVQRDSFAHIYNPKLIPLFLLHFSDGTSHESAEPSRGDVNGAGRVQTVGPLLTSALVLLVSLSTL